MKLNGYCADCGFKFNEYEEYLFFCPFCSSRNVCSITSKEIKEMWFQ